MGLIMSFFVNKTVLISVKSGLDNFPFLSNQGVRLGKDVMERALKEAGEWESI